MTKRTASKAEITKRRRDVAEKYLSGKYQEEIALELGISQATVSRDVKYLIQLWEDNSLEDIRTMRAEQKAALELLERETAANYFKLKESLSAPQAEPNFLWRHLEKNMSIWLKILERKEQLFGLDLPVKVELSGEGLQPKHRVVTYRFPENDRNKEFLENLEKQKQENKK